MRDCDCACSCSADYCCTGRPLAVSATVTDQEIWDNHYMGIDKPVDDDGEELSPMESAILYTGFTLVFLLLVACAALIIGIFA